MVSPLSVFSGEFIANELQCQYRFRAYVTTKSEAFCAPMGMFWNEEWAEGSNALTKDEHLLIETHERMGRPDLADCVRNGRIYQRLMESMRDDDPFNPRLHHINALRDAFLGDKAGKPFETIEEWKAAKMRDYGDDDRIREIEAWVKTRRREKKAERKRIKVGEGPPKLAARKKKVDKARDHKEPGSGKDGGTGTNDGGPSEPVDITTLSEIVKDLSTNGESGATETDGTRRG